MGRVESQLAGLMRKAITRDAKKRLSFIVQLIGYTPQFSMDVHAAAADDRIHSCGQQIGFFIFV